MSMHQESIEIYLVEDASFRQEGFSLTDILTTDNHIILVGKTENLEESFYQLVGPEIVVFGIRGFSQATYESIRRLKLAIPMARFVVVSDSDVALMQAAQAGVQGCISVHDGLKGLLDDLHAVHQGNIVVSGNLALKLIQQRQHVYDNETRYAHLTGREKDILHYLGYGLRNLEIGRQLGISDRTVQYHTGRILRKLGCRNRSELMSYLSSLRATREVGN